MADEDFLPPMELDKLRNPNAGDEKLLVKFYFEPVRDDEKSKAAGRAIHVDREYITILTPGKKDEVVRPAREEDHMRFPAQYAAFKKGEEQITGTRLSEWSGIGRSQVRDMEAVNVLTVEQLAGLDDVNLQRLGMGARELRDRAKAFMEEAAGGAPIARLIAENAEKDSQIAALTQQIKDLAARVQAQEAAPPANDFAATLATMQAQIAALSGRVA